MNFFRIQEAGIKFEEMKKFASADGGDGHGEAGGLCCQLEPDGTFGGAWPAFVGEDGLDGEVIIFRGRPIAEIYDGYRAEPIDEIARFSVEEWEEKINDGSAWDYEDWD